MFCIIQVPGILSGISCLLFDNLHVVHSLGVSLPQQSSQGRLQEAETLCLQQPGLPVIKAHGCVVECDGLDSVGHPHYMTALQMDRVLLWKL